MMHQKLTSRRNKKVTRLTSLMILPKKTKVWNYSLGEETENYMDPDDEGAENETPTPSSPCQNKITK